MCDPLVLVLPTGQVCIDDLANGGRHHYQSTKASTGLLIIIHTSSPQLSLSPSPIWSACPSITNHSWLSPKLFSMFSIVSGVFLTSRISSALDFSCAGFLQSAPSSSVHSPQMSHKSTLRMRTNPCQVYSTNLILSVHPPQIRPPPTTCPVEPTQIVGPPISHTHISMFCIEKLLRVSNDVYPQKRKAFWLLDTSHNWFLNFLNSDGSLLASWSSGISNLEFGILDFEIRILFLEFDILDLEFEILDLEFEIPDFGIWNPWFRIWNPWCGIWNPWWQFPSFLILRPVFLGQLLSLQPPPKALRVTER